MYISQDPIRVNGGLNLYGYVANPNLFLDIWGLAWTYYQLKKDGKIVYHGITERPPQERFQEHAKDGKVFDEVTFVDDLPNRVAARDMEGSSLYMQITIVTTS